MKVAAGKIGINPYLFFPGTCEEAFNLYARVLGGEIAFLMRYGQAPEGGSRADWKDKLMHVSLKVGEQVIMGGDAPPGHQKTPQGFSTSLTVGSIADAERIFTGLAEGGSVFMPLAETFFAERFGMLADRYGMAWMVNFPGAVDARNAAQRAKSAGEKAAGASAPAKPRSSAARKKP